MYTQYTMHADTKHAELEQNHASAPPLVPLTNYKLAQPQDFTHLGPKARRIHVFPGSWR